MPAIAKGAIVFTGTLTLSWSLAAGVGRLPWSAMLRRAKSSTSGWRSAIPHKMRPIG
jgi:hypothetical protein